MESFPICFIMSNTLSKPKLNLTNSRVALVIIYFYKTTQTCSLPVLRSTAAYQMSSHHMFSGSKNYLATTVTQKKKIKGKHELNLNKEKTNKQTQKSSKEMLISNQSHMQQLNSCMDADAVNDLLKFKPSIGIER